METLDKDISENVVYYTYGKNVEAYFSIGGYLIPYSSTVYKEDELNFDFKSNDKKEARFQAMLYAIRNGGSISSYKSSPYYNYYVKRLKKEYPELLI